MLQVFLLMTVCMLTVALPARECNGTLQQEYIRDTLDACRYWQCGDDGRNYSMPCAPGTSVPDDYDSLSKKYITDGKVHSPCHRPISEKVVCRSRGNDPIIKPTIWSEWKEDGSCSKSCDGGESMYVQTCSGDGCPTKPRTKQVKCNIQPCHVWTAWNSKDTPDNGDGDWEVDVWSCPEGRIPTDGECRVIETHADWMTTGLKYTVPCGPQGIGCSHLVNDPSYKPPGQMGKCKDMEVRFKCSLATP